MPPGDPRLEALASEVLEGRCVAFVGAGFSMAPHSDGRRGPPSWLGLLEFLCSELRERNPEIARKLGEWLRPTSGGLSALDFEAVGQALADELGEAFEPAVQKALRLGAAPPGDEDQPTTLWRRRKLLREIPFRAVLTTNYDTVLDDPCDELDCRSCGYAPEASYWNLLRTGGGWWQHGLWSNEESGSSPLRLVKLHGHADGDPQKNPIVLGRKDYRRLLYGDGRYANFLRTVFATKTVLFLGVSFTDAYLNELRSEVLQLLSSQLGPQTRPPPWYAVLKTSNELQIKYFEEHEGICLLPYAGEGHTGLDAWLEALWERTAPVQRLRALFRSRAGRGHDPASAVDVVWYDPNLQNNQYGFGVFEEAGVRVETIERLEDLRPDHLRAKLLLTRFGYRPGREPEAVELLGKLANWGGERPPVVVFAAPSPQHAAENRALALRHGAHEYAVHWDELFEVIERLFTPRFGTTA
ncbi:MAG: SIR2 family protein [Planctomycetota bacterium]|nr:MAG: SIR2 family protein [Planctomycetota bacterium]